MENKNLIVIEPNTSSGIFLLESAKRNGITVYAVTHQNLYEEEYPEYVKTLIDGVYFTDFKDQKKCVQQIIDYFKFMSIDGVVTGFEFTSDIAILVARGLGLPTHELNNINSLRNKFEMYLEFSKNDIPCAKTEIVSSWDECLEKHSNFAFPLIVKPVSNAGSCGVKLVNNLLELEDAFKNIQMLGDEFPHGIPLSSDVLLQEYLIGDEYSVECAMGGGNFFVLGITDKFTTDDNFFAETSHIFPSSLNTEKKEQISKCVLKLLKSFKLTNGVAHVEVMMTNNGPKVIEIGARLPGDYIPRLIFNALGINQASLYIKAAFGLQVSPEYKTDLISGITFIQSTVVGHFKSIDGLKKINRDNYIQDIYLLPGDLIKTPSDNIDRIGHIIITENTYSKTRDNLENSKKNLTININ